MKTILGITVLLGGILSVDAHAMCGDLTLSGHTGPTVNWTESFTSQQFNFTINRTGNGACNAYVYFSDGGASSYATRRVVHVSDGSKTIPYQLYKSSALSSANILMEPPDSTNDNTRVLPRPTFSGNVKSRPAQYHLEIPAASVMGSTMAKAGTYTDTFTMRVYENNSQDAAYNVTLTVTIPVVAKLSLVTSGGAFNEADVSETLDFGNLTQGETLSFDMRVVTNAGYSIAYSSQGDGAMRHSNPAMSTTVPYTVIVNGVEYSLVGSQSNPVSVVTNNVETGQSGAAIPVTFKIGNVANKVSGNYSDNITVTLTSLN